MLVEVERLELSDHSRGEYRDLIALCSPDTASWVRVMARATGLLSVSGIHLSHNAMDGYKDEAPATWPRPEVIRSNPPSTVAAHTSSSEFGRDDR